MSVCIRFSGLTIRLNPLAPVEFDRDVTALMCDECVTPDAEYDICPLTTPLSPVGSPVYNNQGTMIYRHEEGWLRVYPLKISEDGCQVACLLRQNRKNVLYYPASMWEHYTRPLKCMPLLGLELLLMTHHAFLLHSSVIVHRNQAIAFCGPPAIGKSTQAELWHRHLGAEILNGDRCIVMRKGDGFYGGGGPLAGSSGIYRPEQYPLAAIVILEQSTENRIERQLSPALPVLLSQTLVNSWDPVFMNELSILFQQLMQEVPIYRLSCRADTDAVMTAHNAVFGAP